ncbi:MAG TPA: RsmD family RNA methyltransferase, partial [Bacteroidota bacterium]|nr:RsmD family RNA methyltransferase [Bacteroidota bacterium]
IDWRIATVLDLYAGSGSVGIEALSRGAVHTTFVEVDRKAYAFLQANVSLIKAEADATLVFGSVDHYLSVPRTPFTVVFADPPYALGSLSSLPGRIFASGVVAPDGMLVIEHPAHHTFDHSDTCEALIEKTYGRTAVTYFIHTQPSRHEDSPVSGDV